MEPRLKFQRERSFQQELQTRVEERLAALGRTRYGALRLYLKTIVLILWFVGSYAGMLVSASIRGRLLPWPSRWGWPSRPSASMWAMTATTARARAPRG